MQTLISPYFSFKSNFPIPGISLIIAEIKDLSSFCNFLKESETINGEKEKEGEEGRKNIQRLIYQEMRSGSLR